uniref:Uncharacterized protein n=1 Tax=Pithovirus LCDPAC02 TaxID=2506601 RepID=A0A481YRC3_9VIRU|nr:MAG: hypothetical protein LCDPAC02_02130 [Pithovirus LCDPAC02]
MNFENDYIFCGEEIEEHNAQEIANAYFMENKYEFNQMFENYGWYDVWEDLNEENLLFSFDNVTKDNILYDSLNIMDYEDVGFRYFIIIKYLHNQEDYDKTIEEYPNNIIYHF